MPVGVAFRSTGVFFPLVTGKDSGCGVAYLRFAKAQLARPFDKAAHYRAFERAVHGATDEGLGGGNHFLSLEESEQYFYVLVHTGSRNLGIQWYQENYALLQRYNPGGEWLPTEVADKDYQRRYAAVLDYASARRRQFCEKILAFLQRNKYVGDMPVEYADSCHNLLEFGANDVIHRKGSTQLVAGRNAVLPLSMSRGSLIVRPDPHVPYALSRIAQPLRRIRQQHPAGIRLRLQGFGKHPGNAAFPAACGRYDTDSDGEVYWSMMNVVKG
ncbi:MAG: hypothetical protein EOP50_04060 [Sphingobacteriales bacterium]|nr:MAG: hypothetical protein EOP50_04060 [Sphingobacteriales bacterium]